MPHISKKDLSKRDFYQIYDQFVRSLDNLSGRKAKERFLWEFLTPTEKIMLSKRLAIIFLLEKGISPYDIWKKLDVSSSTVERIGKKLDRGGYREVTRSFKNKDSMDEWFEILSTAGGIMPPRFGSRKKWLASRK